MLSLLTWSQSLKHKPSQLMEMLCCRTVFDIDLDTLEDKPWRRSGVDPTDYFNFGFVESSWKQYCRQLVLLNYPSIYFEVALIVSLFLLQLLVGLEKPLYVFA